MTNRKDPEREKGYQEWLKQHHQRWAQIKGEMEPTTCEKAIAVFTLVLIPTAAVFFFIWIASHFQP